MTTETELDAAVRDFADRFRGRSSRPRAPPTRSCRAAGPVRRAAPERGCRSRRILGELEAVGGGLAGGTGGRYFGYVTGGALPAAAIVEAWTAAVDQNVGMWPLGPAAVELELVTIGWLADLLGFSGRVRVFRVGRDDGEHGRARASRGTGSAESTASTSRSRACARCPSSPCTAPRSCTSPITRRCARSVSAPAASARSRSTIGTRCAWICSGRGDRARSRGRDRARDRDRAGGIGQHRRLRPDRRDRRRLRGARHLAARRRRLRRVLPPLGAGARARRRASSARTRSQSTRTSG